jgi:hypothetical protein
MPPALIIPPELREKVILQLKAGTPWKTTHLMYKDEGLTYSGVKRIAQEEGVDALLASSHRRTAMCKNNYDAIDRIALESAALDRISRMITNARNARDMKDLMIALGIAIDKRRLEEGGKNQEKSAIISIFEEMAKQELNK